jgi:hypothetical protein
MDTGWCSLSWFMFKDGHFCAKMFIHTQTFYLLFQEGQQWKPVHNVDNGRWSTYFGIAISPMRRRYTYHYSSISGTTNNNITTRTPPSGVVRPRLFWRHTHKSDDLLSASSHTHGIMRVMPSQSWYIPLPSSFVASSHALQQYRDRLLQRHPV